MAAPIFKSSPVLNASRPDFQTWVDRLNYHKYKYIINWYKKRVSILTEDEARTILIEYANQKCCYGVKPAKELTFTDFQPSKSYRVKIVLNEVRLIFEFLNFKYLLNSFYETRATQTVFAPYRGKTALDWLY